jgi:hypothetical protein
LGTMSPEEVFQQFWLFFLKNWPRQFTMAQQT